jgi:dipeptidyl-peptidase-4
MMRKFIIALLLSALASAAQAQKTITIDDVFQYFRFYPQSAGGYHYRKDGHHYIKADKKALHLYDVRTPDQDSVLTMNLPESASAFDRFTFTDDESKVLLRAEVEPVYRHSVRAKYYVYDFTTGTTTPVYESEKQQFAALSPDGTSPATIFITAI